MINNVWLYLPRIFKKIKNLYILKFEAKSKVHRIYKKAEHAKSKRAVYSNIHNVYLCAFYDC